MGWHGLLASHGFPVLKQLLLSTDYLSRSCFRTSRAAVRRGWRSQARSDDEQYCIEMRRGGATQHGTARRKQRPCEVLKPLLVLCHRLNHRQEQDYFLDIWS